MSPELVVPRACLEGGAFLSPTFGDDLEDLGEDVRD